METERGGWDNLVSCESGTVRKSIGDKNELS
jgi:hypothetical protein